MTQGNLDEAKDMGCNLILLGLIQFRKESPKQIKKIAIRDLLNLAYIEF